MSSSHCNKAIARAVIAPQQPKPIRFDTSSSIDDESRLTRGSIMKRIWLGAFALATMVAAPALGADLRLPVKAPVAPLPAYGWTGWYIGVNAGAAIDNTSYNLDPSGCFLLGCGVGGFAGNPARTFASTN